MKSNMGKMFSAVFGGIPFPKVCLANLRSVSGPFEPMMIDRTLAPLLGCSQFWA
jgi:hypothetical protein